MKPGAAERLDQILAGTSLDEAIWRDSHLHALLVERIEAQARRIHRLAPSETETLARDALTELWAARDRYRGEVAVRSYLGGIVRNLALVALRSRAPQADDDAASETPDAAPGVPDLVAAGELRAAIDEATRLASSRDAEAFELLAAHGATVAEVCIKLQILPNALHQRVARFRAVVRLRLEERGFLSKRTPPRGTGIHGTSGVRTHSRENG
ncbi:MAG: RNA polymerase sigma factor [Planctomycetes bacterium]|nr:RNA polymerase sigma factor [Planctomycetota bacterium]